MRSRTAFVACLLSSAPACRGACNATGASAPPADAGAASAEVSPKAQPDRDAGAEAAAARLGDDLDANTSGCGKGRLDDLLRKLDSVDESDLGDPEATAREAYGELRAGDVDDAEEGFHQALRMRPSRLVESQVRFNLGLIAARRHQPGAARAAFLHAYLLHPNPGAGAKLAASRQTPCDVSVYVSPSFSDPFVSDAGTDGGADSGPPDASEAVLPSVDFSGWEAFARARGAKTREEVCAQRPFETLLSEVDDECFVGCTGQGPWAVYTGDDDWKKGDLVVPYEQGLRVFPERFEKIVTAKCVTTEHVMRVEMSNGIVHLNTLFASAAGVAPMMPCIVNGIFESDEFIDVASRRVLGSISRTTGDITPDPNAFPDLSWSRVGGKGCHEWIRDVDPREGARGY